MKAPTVATLYPRHGDFVSLQERLDPRGAFAPVAAVPGARHLGWEWGRHPALDGAQRDRATAHSRV